MYIFRLLAASMALSLVLFVAGSASQHSVYSDNPNHNERVDAVMRAADWIASQIHTGTGNLPATNLIRSYDNPAEFNAWTYDQAVGTMALLETGRMDEAEQVLDAMKSRLPRDESESLIRPFADGYVWDTGGEILGAETRATGPNAWMGLAFIHAHAFFPDKGYLQNAVEIAEWLITNLKVQSPPACPSMEGAFLGGISPGENQEPFEWISTEHNADMLAFLRGLQSKNAPAPSDGTTWEAHADQLEDWLKGDVTESCQESSGLWDDPNTAFDNPNQFAVGYQDVGKFSAGGEELDNPTVSTFNEVLDSQTWTILALEASARVTGNPVYEDYNGLGWLDENWMTSIQCGGENRRGFSKRTFNNTFEPFSTKVNSYWTEGMAGYALARLLIPSAEPDGLSWARVVEDIKCFQQNNGGVLYSVGESINLCDFFDADSRVHNSILEPCENFTGGDNEAPIAVFSTFNNFWGGEPGVFGDALPDWKNRGQDRLVSWFYSLGEVGTELFNPENVRTPEQSFALVNDSDRTKNRMMPYPGHNGVGGWNNTANPTAWNPHNWASFTLSLNIRDASCEPPNTGNITNFDELRFFARADSPVGNEKTFIRVTATVVEEIGDSECNNPNGKKREKTQHYWPAVDQPAIEVPYNEWLEVKVKLDDLIGEERDAVESIGLAFGNEVDLITLNQDQATLWIDDFSLFPTNEPLPDLKVFPDNWAWSSVAGTAWLIFAELHFNPFASGVIDIAPPGKCGDVNGDNEFNVLDSILSLSSVVLKFDPSPIEEFLGDLNRTGFLEIVDIMESLFSIVTGDSFPSECGPTPLSLPIALP